MFVFQRNTLTMTAHHKTLDSFGNVFAFTSEWLTIFSFTLQKVQEEKMFFSHVLLRLLSFLFQAYTIQGQYAIPHPDVSFYSIS